MIKRTGAYTIAFESQPVIAGWGSVVGKKEAEGPLKNYFDKIIYDSYDGCDTFEQAESMFQGEALEKLWSVQKHTQTRSTAFSQEICSTNASDQALDL